MGRFFLLMLILAVDSSHLPMARAEEPPTSWVDKDTGHRVIRLTQEPGSSGLYFNVNAYSPDGKLMIYVAPDGLHVLELATLKTRLLVPNPPENPATHGTTDNYRNGLHAIVVGRKTNSIFFTKPDPATHSTSLYKANMYTGEVKELVTLPPRASIATINADETLGVGTYDETEAGVAQEYGRARPSPASSGAGGARPQAGNLVQPEGKGEMMERRLAARIPVVLYTINLESGKVTPLLHSTDWIGHMLFSPTDPTLLMYCHEGPWHKVDRIWMIHTDGSHNTLIHKRTMAMEIAGMNFGVLTGTPSGMTGSCPRAKTFSSPATTLKPTRALHTICSGMNGPSTLT